MGRSPLSERSLAVGLGLNALAACFFGLQGIFARLAYDHGANVAGAVAVRAAVVAPVLVLVLVAATRRAKAFAARRQLATMAAISVINTTTYFVAVDRMSPALVTLVVYIYPALAVVFSRLLGWTPITALTVVATASTLGGVVLTIGVPEGTIDGLATALALVNGVLFACWLLLAQAALRRADPLTVFAAATGAAQLVVLAGAFVVSDPDVARDAEGVVYLVATGLVSTIVAFMLQLHGLERLGGAATALVTSLEIVTVVGLSAVIFDEPVGVGLALGGLLVITGAVLAPVSTHPEEVAGLLRATRRRARAAVAAPRSPRG